MTTIDINETSIEDRQIAWLTLLSIRQDIQKNNGNLPLRNKWNNAYKWYLENKLLTRA